jgi:hypothetical protein
MPGQSPRDALATENTEFTEIVEFRNNFPDIACDVLWNP